MNKPTRQVGYFLSGQSFSNGLRVTLSILMPALMLAQVGQFPAGLAMSLGALSVSISDAPGPLQHRRNGMLATVLLGAGVTLITGFARMNPVALGLEILLFSFLFSLLSIYGNRAASVGTAALLILILTLDRPLDAAGVLRQSGLVLAGGGWYAALSLLASRLQPYRPARQALGRCIHETARLLAIKADFYALSTRLDDDYHRFLDQQVVVSEQQDAVRELLFKSRRFVTETTPTGRSLVLLFVDLVDLYEQIVALYYDYALLRERFGSSGVLALIAELIRQLAVELDQLGLVVQSPVAVPTPPDRTGPSLGKLKQAIDALGDDAGSTLVLRKVFVSLRSIRQRLTAMGNPPGSTQAATGGSVPTEYGRFVGHRVIDFQSFRDNLTFDSSAFRHAVRVASALTLGFILTKLLPYGHHSYWVLLTISVILKPAFSLTRQRNTERILGTLAGGILGVEILTFVPDQTGRFAIMVLCMLGTYTAQRGNYIVMVVCLTPFVLILFSFLGVSYLGVAQERFLDTLLGGLIALAVGYGLVPRWESGQLTEPIRAVLNANLRYVRLLLERLSGRRVRVLDYKVVRKDVYVASANLTAAFDRMLAEPKHKQRNEKLVYEFVVLNHILSANVAALMSTGPIQAEPVRYPASQLRPLKRALFSLTESLRRLGTKPEQLLNDPVASQESVPVLTPDDLSVKEQLEFIGQVSRDIDKLVERLSAPDG